MDVFLASLVSISTSQKSKKSFERPVWAHQMQPVDPSRMAGSKCRDAVKVASVQRRARAMRRVETLARALTLSWTQLLHSLAVLEFVRRFQSHLSPVGNCVLSHIMDAAKVNLRTTISS